MFIVNDNARPDGTYLLCQKTIRTIDPVIAPFLVSHDNEEKLAAMLHAEPDKRGAIFRPDGWLRINWELELADPGIWYKKFYSRLDKGTSLDSEEYTEALASGPFTMVLIHIEANHG